MQSAPLSFADSRAVPQLSVPPGLRLREHRGLDAARRRVEEFIEIIFASRFGARIDAWAPNLVSLESGGEIFAAAGYRSARTRLYLEHYLAQPVEHAIAAVAGVEISREQIAEVGHLAAARAGSSPMLMLALGRHLAADGVRWAVGTATREVRQIFGRLGIRAHVLGTADPDRLGQGAAAWGRYYEHGPVVVAGDLVGNLDRVASVLYR